MIKVLLVIFILVIFYYLLRGSKKKNESNSNGNLMTLDDRYNTSKIETQKELDRLLDKIGKKGYNSLSKREKDLLNEYSKKL